MQKYEIMAIVANNLKAKDAEKYVTDEICSLIKKSDGTMTFEDFWGDRGFAYKINKEKWGYYFVGQFEIDPSKLNELKREWNLAKKLVRFLITKVDPKAPEIKKYEDIQKEIAVAEKEKKIAEVDSKKGTKKTVITAKSTKKVESAAKPVEPKKDAIDKKLGEILEDSSLDL